MPEVPNLNFGKDPKIILLKPLKTAHLSPIAGL
jgi:hypothetical protein